MTPTFTEEPRSKKSSILDDPDRFRTAKSTLTVDRFMTRFIRVGGVSLIAAVFAIFVFIFIQILPLFGHAKVKSVGSYPVPPGDHQALGVDEWGELPFVIDEKGALTFIPLHDGRKPIKADLPMKPVKELTAFRYIPAKQEVVYGSADGHVSWMTVDYGTDFKDEKRTVTQELSAVPWITIGSERWPITAVDFGDFGSEKLLAVVQEKGAVWQVHAARLIQSQSLFGAGEISVADRYDFTDKISSKPAHLLVNNTADGVFVGTDKGAVHYFHRTGDQFELRQTFEPFKGASDPKISQMSFLFGDVSIVFTNPIGENRVFSLYMPKNTETRLFGQTKQFPTLPGRPQVYAPSLRNKSFLIGTSDTASLRHSTTEEVRWQTKLPFQIKAAALSGKYEKMFFLDSTSRIHEYSLKDPHPEASFKAFFGKIWYEGSSEPKYEWQSTGGSDDFEPKLSMIPLIIGTLKGTFYAMFFALPIALLAAIYTSQFLNARIRAVAKPTMEIMASLPSVVLGFLAALWLAPLIERRVPSILLMLLVVPACACALGMIFQQMPIRVRQWVKSGLEFVVFVPVFLAAVWLCWHLGPVMEKFWFVATDPVTGVKVADFRYWWPQVTGATFDQRNSLAVGFMMGFAVIPIIFTIAEDSLSNVPEYLRSGSLALGASRWQTAIFVVLPTAFPGIFSGLMVGLGRAIGETMIVVMATGNTPVMDFNIFSGMRTLSANIAVELPEAPHHSTLYRALFLGALVLFLATFIVNTVAELLRQRIREKYKAA